MIFALGASLAAQHQRPNRPGRRTKLKSSCSSSPFCARLRHRQARGSASALTVVVRFNTSAADSSESTLAHARLRLSKEKTDARPGAGVSSSDTAPMFLLSRVQRLSAGVPG